MVLKVAIKFPTATPSRVQQSNSKKMGRKKKQDSQAASAIKKPRKYPVKRKSAEKNTPKNLQGSVKIPASFDSTKQACVVLERLVQLSDGRFVIPTPEDVNKNQDDSSSVATRIPSQVLETFGIMTPTPNSSPRNEYLSPFKIMQSSAMSNCDEVNEESEAGIGILPDPLETFAQTKNTHSSPAKSFLSSIDLPQGSMDTASRTSTPRPSFQFDQFSHFHGASHVIARLSYSPLPGEATPGSNGAEDLCVSNCDYAFALGERLLNMPPRVSIDDLVYGNSVIRRLAPYALRVCPTKDLYFQYVAVRSKVDDFFHCVVVNQFEQSLVAYGGHFIVHADRLFDPSTRAPVDGDITVTSVDNLRVHLTLFGVPNKKLLGVPGYFLEPKEAEYAEELANAVDGMLAIVDQVRLREHFDVEQRIRNHSRTASSDGTIISQSSAKRRRLV